jgi:hypothetical protein
MAVNLVTNVQEALEGFPVANSYCWLDSTVALHWIRGEGNYKQFVQNRVNKIQQKDVEWRYVPTHENPADFGSRGDAVTQTIDNPEDRDWKRRGKSNDADVKSVMPLYYAKNMCCPSNPRYQKQKKCNHVLYFYDGE